jgi:hypothetical protein
MRSEVRSIAVMVAACGVGVDKAASLPGGGVGN